MEMAEDKLSCYVGSMLTSHGMVVEAVTWERVQQAAMTDPAMQKLRRLLEEGFPYTRNNMGDSVREFFQVPGRPQHVGPFRLVEVRCGFFLFL